MKHHEELKDLTVKDLISTRDDLKKKLREVRFEKVVGSNFSSSEYRKARKKIARINTILKEIEAGKRKAAEASK